MSSSPALNDTKTFKLCTEYRNNLGEGGHDGWRLFSYDELVQFAIKLGSVQVYWTTDIMYINDVELKMNRIISNLSDVVRVIAELQSVEYYCRCVR